MSGGPLLELDRVDKRFGPTVACNGVSFRLEPGEVVGLVGESGSGKSTIANLVLGLLAPDAGSLRFDGRAVGDWLRGGPRAYAAHVQAVFQQPLLALDRRFPIHRCVSEPLLIHGIGDRSSRAERVDELLRSVGLDPALGSRRPRELSGGQLQRVNIARALALSPRLLVCDEPVSALDVSVQAQILNLFLDIQERLSTAMLFISHDLGVVRHLSDRIVVLSKGTVVEQGSTEDVCRNPRHPYTAALLAAAPDLRVSRPGRG